MVKIKIWGEKMNITKLLKASIAIFFILTMTSCKQDNNLLENENNVNPNTSEIQSESETEENDNIQDRTQLSPQDIEKEWGVFLIDYLEKNQITNLEK